MSDHQPPTLGRTFNPLDSSDFERGGLHQQSFIRPQRLFTVEATVILYSVGKVRPSKLSEALAKVRNLFGQDEQDLGRHRKPSNPSESR